MTLANTQNQMKDALLGAEIDSNLSVQLSDERRLFIYQNTIFGQLLDVLSSTYGAIKAVVGEKYFAMLAQSYIREHPPKEASLTYYGGEFPAYLKQQEALQAMPYLFDMADYEWAWNHAFFAVNAEYLDPSALSSLNEDDLEHISFILHPSVRLLTVNYPVYELWQWVEAGANDPAPNIVARQHKLVVWRNALHEVMVETIAADDFAVWENIVASMPISKAFEELAPSSQGEWLEKLLMSSMVSSYAIKREQVK